jgi:hypothetical protein
VKPERNLASYEVTLVSLDRYSLLLSENVDHHPPKNELFSQEMYLKIPLSTQGLKLTNSKLGGTVPALHFFVEEIPPMAS